MQDCEFWLDAFGIGELVSESVSKSRSYQLVSSLRLTSRQPGRVTSRRRTHKKRKMHTTYSLAIATSSSYGVVPKRLLTFLGLFVQCGVQSLLGTSGIYPGTYSFGSFAGLFRDAIVSCEMTRARTMAKWF